MDDKPLSMQMMAMTDRNMLLIMAFDRMLIIFLFLFFPNNGLSLDINACRRHMLSVLIGSVSVRARVRA